jgi:hypothetical protein
MRLFAGDLALRLQLPPSGEISRYCLPAAMSVAVEVPWSLGGGVLRADFGEFFPIQPARGRAGRETDCKVLPKGL